MATLIRVGTTVVNLDRVTHAIVHGYGTAVYFSADEDDHVIFRDEVGIAVAAYLENEAAMDVLAWHAGIKLREAEDAAFKAALHANIALLEYCTDQAGHAWKPAPADGFDCVRCGAHDKSHWLSQAIDCWGGVEAGTP